MDEVHKYAKAERSVSQPASWILRVLDALRCGGSLLDFRGRVLALNVIALSFLGDGLVLGADRLSATDRITDQRLQGMVDSALVLTKKHSANLCVAVQRRSGPPLVVRLVRLEEDGQRAPGLAMFLLLMLDPQTRQKPAPEILTQAFALTRAEVGYRDRHSVRKDALAQIAAARGIKIGTVRSVLKERCSRRHRRVVRPNSWKLVITRLAFLAPQTEAATLQPTKAIASVARRQDVIEGVAAHRGRRRA